MSFDAIVALVVVAIMFAILLGVIWWARGAPPYDDGRSATSIRYAAEPDDPRQLPSASRRDPGATEVPGPTDDPGAIAADGDRSGGGAADPGRD